MGAPGRLAALEILKDMQTIPLRAANFERAR
jgi:hypothetical protein